MSNWFMEKLESILPKKRNGKESQIPQEVQELEKPIEPIETEERKILGPHGNTIFVFRGKEPRLKVGEPDTAEWHLKKLEEEKEKQRMEEEAEKEKKRFETFVETGRDYEGEKEERKKEKEEEKLEKIIKRALRWGVPISKIEEITGSNSPIEYQQAAIESLAEEAKRTRDIRISLERQEKAKEWAKRLEVAGKLLKGPSIPAKRERTISVSLGKGAGGWVEKTYIAGGMRPLVNPPKPVVVEIGAPLRKGFSLEPLRQATMVFPQPWKTPLAQLVMPTRIPPTTVTFPTPTREETIPQQLQVFMREQGYEPVEPVRMPAYFFIGTKRGVESSDNAWIVRMRTGRYGVAGIGKVTGKPRSKISWVTPEEALDAAGEVPGKGKYPIIG
jgi:hypothetical protein